MFYNPPPKWTEELLDELPLGEDDRYEWKSGNEIFSNDRKELDKFFNNLATEIGAFSNSFGGTLFIGIADNKDKIGIPAIKGRTPIERWLENKIPTLFELRLQHYRVSRLELTPATQAQISSDKIIVAIDVFDSELAPHQCIFDNRYYYRSNSSSVPAPHHYLAFLWGRANSNMPQVATWWLKDFLDPVITWLDKTQKNFNEKRFLLEEVGLFHCGARMYKINFFNNEEWNKFMSSGVGDYFLSTFPQIKKELLLFSDSKDEFNKLLSELENLIESSNFYLEMLKDTIYTERHSINKIARDEIDKLNLKEITALVLGKHNLPISKYDVESKNTLVRYVTYSLLELNIDFVESAEIRERIPLDISKTLSSRLRDNQFKINTLSERIKELISVIGSESLLLLERLKKNELI